MISWSPYLCPACGSERYQRIVFIGGEFAYRCPECLAIHCFYETLFYRFQETWKHPVQRRRFAGTYSNGGIAGDEAGVYARLCRKWERADSEYQDSASLPGIEVRRLSERHHQGRFFVASALHDHFNEAFRGVVRMRDHILNRMGAKTYNILLAFDAGPLRSMMDGIDVKLPGLDELWLIAYDKTMRWPYAPDGERADPGTLVNLSITRQFDNLEGVAEVISKRPGPLPQGDTEIRRLLEPLHDETLTSTRGLPLHGRYIVILLHEDNEARAGLFHPDQVAEARDLILERGERALLLIVDRRPVEAFANLSGLTITRQTDITSQAQLFRDHSKGVIGANSSGCNLPALYGMPILAFVKGRPFPDDFYCFGRMTSNYREDHTWHGELEKADNIAEVAVEPKRATRPLHHAQAVRRWFADVVARPVDYRGADEVKRGFRACCPGCRTEQRSRSFRLTGSDLCVEFYCETCETPYISYRGLTTQSELEVFFANECRSNRRGQRYLELPARPDPPASGQPGAVEQLTLSAGESRAGPRIAFYCMKPSISDLYYMLPSVFQIRESLPDACVIAIIPGSHRELIPDGICDELWLVNVDPYQFDRDGYSSAHAELEYWLGVHDISVINSNYPGDLPFGSNTYRYLRQRFAPPKPDRHVYDVAVFCRLGSRRQWPDPSVGSGLCRALERRGLSYRLLAFPAYEQAPVPRWLAQCGNLESDPGFQRQLKLLAGSRVCVTPHGASEVPAAIAARAIVELETQPPHWRDPTPQPMRYGFSGEFRKCVAASLGDISVEDILHQIEQLLVDDPFNAVDVTTDASRGREHVMSC